MRFGDFGVCWPWESEKECQIKRDVESGMATTEADLALAKERQARINAELAERARKAALSKEEAKAREAERIRLAAEFEAKKQEIEVHNIQVEATKQETEKRKLQIEKNKKIIMVGGSILALLAVGSFYLKDKT